MYYQHAVDRCDAYGRPKHSVEQRTILVGYACSVHSSFAFGDSGSKNTKPTGQKKRGRFVRRLLKLTTDAAGIDAGVLKPGDPADRDSSASESSGTTTGSSLYDPIRPAANVEPVSLRRVELQKPALGRDVSLHQTYDEEKCSVSTQVLSGERSDESDSEDCESVFSGVSAPSSDVTVPTEPEQEAIEALFRDVLNEFSLRYLWPQVVGLSIRRHTAEKQIARFLARFSGDLKQRAESRLDHDAARFIRVSRLNIARRIVDCHAAELGSSDKPRHVTVLELPREEEEEEEEELVEEDGKKTDETSIIYEGVRGFILNGEPFQGFILALKLFVARTSIPETPIPAVQVGPASLRQKFDALASTLWPSPIPSTKRRLPWSCVSRCA